MRTRLFCIALMALLAILAFSPAAMAEATPEDRVKEGVDKLVELLHDPRFKEPSTRQAIFDEIATLSDDYFDYKYLTMMAVGRPWLEMDPAKQDKLIPTFKKVLELNYLPKLEDYSGQKVTYKKQMIRGDKAMVLTEVVDKDKTFSVNYRLVKIDGQWMVYDIIAEGISLVKNYRSQFAEILHDGDVDTLIAKLNEKAEHLMTAQTAEKNE